MDFLYFLFGVVVTLLTLLAARRFVPTLELRPPEIKQLPKITESPVLSRFHEKRAEIMADLYARLASFHRRLQEESRIQSGEGRIYVGAREATPKEVEQRLEREKAAALTEFRELTEYFDTRRIYFERQVAEPMDSMLAAFHKLVAQSVGSESLGTKDGSSLKAVTAQVASAMHVVEARFKALSGLEAA